MTSIERNRRSQDKKRDFLSWLKSVPCIECGGTFHPVVMEFDHIRGRKRLSLSNMVTQRSWADILAEVRKCEIVCSNCHQLRTHLRRAA